MSKPIYTVYWIHRKSQTDPFIEGYVGITKDCKERFKSHSKSKYIVGNAIRKYNDVVMSVLVESVTEQQAKQIESEYRPSKEIGWNIAEGGGVPPNNKGVKRPKQSERMVGKNNPFYGKKHTEDTKRLLSEQKSGKNHPFYGKTRDDHSRKMKMLKGEGYPKFKGWFVTPIGKFDSYKDACEATGLSVGSLYNYCKKSDKIVTKRTIANSKHFNDSHLGKSYKQIGFGFIENG